MKDKFPSWDDAISEITDSRFTILEGKELVRTGARIMYDRIFILLNKSNERPE